MEVHHHPDLHHKKKNLKEYLLEGLMIFLAVTLEFFAETIRENISERHREKDYIAGLINNIQTDTSNLRRIIGKNDLELLEMAAVTVLLRPAMLPIALLCMNSEIMMSNFRRDFMTYLKQSYDITVSHPV